ncbi:Alpha/Beta hydrolase protein [Cristinia sonorae]|uniref:Alpha/Beta hydrolase protein n=1 Tax=Cristinia sonorae TaxID=1940300 RepID=A0A8K0UN48_9AGAR|nr:Alpha/Beta hydrolase protein [Cristinia sonorae]
MAWPLSLFSCANDTEQAEASSSKPNKAHSSAVQSPLLSLLQYFESPGVTLPPSNRIGDPKLKQRETQPLRVWDLWKWGAFAAVKATHVVSAVVSHNIRGPPRKSWGVEMSILCSIMRDTSQHSHLTDVTTLRLLMSFGGLVPVPSDAMVTPVTFRVRKRHLRGILAEFDAAEDGSRELSGEWIVGRRTWQRLQHEWKASKKAKMKGCELKTHGSKRKERVVLYLHGGAYYLFSPATHRLITIPLAKALDARLFAVDYRLAPETRFPGPLHDAVSTYFRMIDDLHIAPENIIVAGDSAGGGLALALMMYLRDNDYPLPGGGILMSPWVDLTMSCDSWESNAPYDIVPMPQPGDHMNPIACYLGEHMEKYLTHPYASPLFGDFAGLPPLLIQSGEAEVLRDEITLLAHKATLAGVEIRHELYEDMVHVFQSFPFLEAANRAFISARSFERSYLSRGDRAKTHQSLEGNAEAELKQEIDNDSARVVQGDGTETGAGREEMGDPDTSSDSDATIPPRDTSPADTEVDSDGASTPEHEPSWFTPSLWPSSLDSDNASVTSKASFKSSSTSKSSRRHSNAALYPHSPSSPSSIKRRTSYTQLPHHPSHSSIKDSGPPPTLLNRPSVLASSMTMTSTSPAPRPSIRRSHSSHPDITSLCQQWVSSGPANQTLTFKPEVVPSGSMSPIGRRSRAVSSTSSRKYII